MPARLPLPSPHQVSALCYSRVSADVRTPPAFPRGRLSALEIALPAPETQFQQNWAGAVQAAFSFLFLSLFFFFSPLSPWYLSSTNGEISLELGLD